MFGLIRASPSESEQAGQQRGSLKNTCFVSHFVSNSRSATMGRPRGGRVRAHERDTNDTNAILGTEIAVRVEDLANIRLAEEQLKEKTTKIDGGNHRMLHRLVHAEMLLQSLELSRSMQFGTR
jgi:hypothetical protein